MADPELWPTIHAERAALAADLANLPEEQWATTSLCANWTVTQALGHMTATAKLTPAKFLANLAKAGFSFEKMAATEIAAETAGGPAATLQRFNSVLSATDHPPGPPTTWLGETIVHAEDIRRPLGIKREYPTAAAVRVADFYKGSNLLIGAKKRIAGLALRATDADWSNGTGAEVSGPIVSLVLAMTGRAAALDDLTGEGVSTLRSRT
ncbi:MAG: hypothetical protein QOF60_1678 [Actinomycetota bacterium]|jgi:uncharacterized protein (TIGR03083 family)|nr:hypothetical protein [Actinomycetota bacterium]